MTDLQPTFEQAITLDTNDPLKAFREDFFIPKKLKQPCIYIMSNRIRGTLYTGVTSNLVKRIWQHRNHRAKGFTNEFSLTRLVYFEIHEDMYNAITREKNIKNWKRTWKIELIENYNPKWLDLFSQIV
jgi:putative endonuclease